jgi:predicted CoA-binding protein
MDYRSFWTNQSYAVVGHSAKKGFPVISYGKLKQLGKTSFPVDPSVTEINGDKTYPDLASLPETVEAVILETPKEETTDWIEKTVTAGINNVWIHMNCDTPEAISLAQRHRMNLFYGTCAVMYLVQGVSIHSFHGWINKLFGKY